MLVSNYETIRVECSEDDIVTVSLNRPEALNALTYSMYDELEDAFSTLTPRCFIVTGTGRGFCAGDDVKEIFNRPEKRHDPASGREPQLVPAARAILATDVPIIAAVNGVAVGWGMELALLADIRIASTDAKFGEFFVKRGICSDAAALIRLPQLVGPEMAAELLYTGRLIDADEAFRIRLVSRVVDPSSLLTVSMELAREIAANPPLAVRSIKEAIRVAEVADWEEVGRWVSQRIHELFRTSDHRESVSAFLEKRTPSFTGQ